MKILINIITTFFAMIGLRIDRLNVYWIMGAVITFAFGHYYVITSNNLSLTLSYFFFTLVFYYFGNGLILSSSIPRLLIANYGEKKAFEIYQTIVGLMFMNQGLGIAAMTSLDVGANWEISISSSYTFIFGGIVFMIGIILKIWSTMILGIDLYYYRDMFLNHSVGNFTQSGPYKIFDNPMYGIGQIHGYGYAIMYQSITGFMAIAICHILIYVFYYSVERPFVRRVYRRIVAPLKVRPYL